MDFTRFGAGLGKLRIEKRLTQEQLGKRTGVSRETINAWEKAEFDRGPHLKNLRMLVEQGKLDGHRLAHYAFDLPEPEEQTDLSDDAKFFLQKFQQLSEADRQQLLGYLDGLQERKGAI